MTTGDNYTEAMDTIISAFKIRRNSTPAKRFLSCGDLTQLYASKTGKPKHKPAKQNSPSSQSSLSNVHSAYRAKRGANRNNDELVDFVDLQLTQIREKLAMMREQDLQFRERMDSLSTSVSELASRSSLSSLECSDLGSLDLTLDEVIEEEEFCKEF